MKDYNAIVGSNIKALRQYREMSQNDLAMKCGHDSPSARTWISKIESGQRATYTTDIGPIADALGVMPATLFMEQQKMDDQIARVKRMLEYDAMLIEHLQRNPEEEE